MSRSTLRYALAALSVLAVSAIAIGGAAATTKSKTATKPTVVFVHGAFADASGWSGVTSRLRSKGYATLAIANPLRGVESDAAYLRAVLATIRGPVVLVGHSYGGVVITNASTGNPNVKALVYVAAYAPDQGDSVGGLGAQIAGGMIGPTTLDIHPYATSADGKPLLEGTIKTSVFRNIFAADLPKSETDLMAVSQRPAAVNSLGEPSGVPGWKTIPSWYIVAGKDNAIGTKLEEFMAKRMKAHTTEIAGASHVVMMSHPEQTAKVVLSAINATD